MLKFICTRKTTVDDVTDIISTIRNVIAAAMEGEETIDGIPIESYIKQHEEKTGILIRRDENNEQREKEEKS